MANIVRFGDNTYIRSDAVLAVTKNLNGTARIYIADHTIDTDMPYREAKDLWMREADILQPWFKSFEERNK